MTYSAPRLGTATIELQAPGTSFPNVTIVELAGESSYSRALVNTITSDGRTAGNVSKILGFKSRFRFWRWEINCRLDPTRAAIVEAMWVWQQRELSEDRDSPIVLIDRFQKCPFAATHTDYTLEPDSIETAFGGLTRGFPACNVILQLAETPTTWVADRLIDVEFTAQQMR